MFSPCLPLSVEKLTLTLCQRLGRNMGAGCLGQQNQMTVFIRMIYTACPSISMICRYWYVLSFVFFFRSSNLSVSVDTSLLIFTYSVPCSAQTYQSIDFLFCCCFFFCKPNFFLFTLVPNSPHAYPILNKPANYCSSWSLCAQFVSCQTSIRILVLNPRTGKW